jgi:hypothetical protein
MHPSVLMISSNEPQPVNCPASVRIATVTRCESSSIPAASHP